MSKLKVKMLKAKKFIEKMNMEKLLKLNKLEIHTKGLLLKEYGQLYVGLLR
jgi:hypothetical protein